MTSLFQRSFTSLFMPLIFASTSFTQDSIPASKVFGRKYKQGDISHYRLTMEEYHDGKWDHTDISVCELKVVRDSAGVPYDEVRWVSKKLLTPKDTIDQLKAAISTNPYRISLDPKGRIDLPAIEFAEMTEPIQDFNTFFVAVSPLVFATKLSKKGDNTALKAPITANFANGSNILKGEDCINLDIKMQGITKKGVTLFSAFSPPLQSCLSFLLPEMNTPVVKDTVNNIQMVILLAPDHYIVQYGRERFDITSVIRRSDGKITSATMINKLNLKMKLNCDKDYSNCQFEALFSEQRNLKLELLKEGVRL